MIITIPWLKEHLKTSAKENEIIDRLTNIGLEVEGLKENSGEMSKFKIAKVLKAEKHPNADKLKVCDVTIGGKEILKVVCGAPNAREGLITIYAPPGAIIPKTNFELKVAKIRGVESKGMLCSESELNLSNESEGIIELKNKEKEIGKSYFISKSEKGIDIGKIGTGITTMLNALTDPLTKLGENGDIEDGIEYLGTLASPMESFANAISTMARAKSFGTDYKQHWKDSYPLAYETIKELEEEEKASEADAGVPEEEEASWWQEWLPEF